jgi:hypothetical protein
MLQLHPHVLSISEWFTVLGERRSLEQSSIGSRAFVRMLSTPSVDVTELLEKYPQINELRIPTWAREESGSRGPPPVAMIPLPRLSADSRALFAGLIKHLLDQPDRTLPDWHHLAFEFMARLQGKPIWFERSGGSLAYIDSLLSAWPRARYVHIYRNGVDCARSMAEHPYFRVRVARVMAGAALPIEKCLDWHIPLDQFGAYWSAVVAHGLRALRTLPSEQVLHIRYEHLVADPRRELQRLQCFLEPNAEADAWVDAAAALVRPAAPRPPSDDGRLRRLCDIGMNMLTAMERPVV